MFEPQPSSSLFPGCFLWERREMDPLASESTTDEEQDDSYSLQRPAVARTVLDVKDRVPAAFQPFIRFDFEPDLSSQSRNKGHNGNRRLSPTSSRVAIDHFDPEGVEHLRSRFSSASEYSLHRTDKNDKISLGALNERKGAVRPVATLDIQLGNRNLRKNMLGSEQFSSSSLTLSSLNTDGLYADKRLSPFDVEAALRETIKQYGASHATLRTLGLGFKDLSVFGADRTLTSQTVYQPTLASTLNPIEWARTILRMRKRVPKRIISGFEGVVNPGEMLLVLGRPGSGCSTLLKALGNQTNSFIHVLGERKYGSFTPRDMDGPLRGGVLYCSKIAHIPSLTIQQAITFAARTQEHSNRLSSRDAEHLAITLMTIFGLRHAKDMLLGDHNNEQIPHAAKRRVSVCEALAGSASICFWDKPSQDLDASATLEFVRALRIATDLSAMTTIVCLSQAGETMYQLFDKVCVVGEGRMYYFGRADAARGYFMDLGYDPLRRQTTADFLISVTDPLGRMQNPNRPFSTPRTPEEFTRAFHRSPLGRENRLEVAHYWQDNVDRRDGSVIRAQKLLSRQTNGAGIIQSSICSWRHGLTAAAYRRFQSSKNNWIPMVVQILLSALQGLIIGLAYWHSSEASSSSVSRDGLLFIAILFLMLSAMFEGLGYGSHRFIALRQHGAVFYRPSIEAIATILFDVPVTFLTQSIFGAMIYGLAGLQRSVGRFLVFSLIITLTALTMKALFRSFTILTTKKETRYSVAGSAVVLLLLFSGFTDFSPTVNRVLRWLTWLNPLRYAFEGLMVNEYHNIEIPCTTSISSPMQICRGSTSIAGQTSVDGDEYLNVSYDYAYDDLWVNIGFLLAFAVTFHGFLLIVSEWNVPVSASFFTLYKRGSRERKAKYDQPDPYRHIRRARLPPDGNDNNEQYEVPLNDVFAWKNLQYAVPQQKGRRVLLDGISGYVAPRKLCALIGGSGVGNTTLLRVLAGRCQAGSMTGDLYLNGKSLPSDFRSQIGFCQQREEHYPKQTVREAMLFSADLRQPATVPRREKEEYIESCLKMCGLESYADAMVCTLSIANQKRASIGIELAAQPRLLFFLDEPTSGLDPQEALSIIALLRDLANHGQAILCAMQEPSSEVLDHFDQLLVLGKGGKMVYFGDIGDDCETAIGYFERNGAHPCIAEDIPTEWINSLIRADDNAYIPVDWHDKWLRSPEVAKLRREIEGFQRKLPQRATSKPCVGSGFVTSWPHQMRTLLTRTNMAYWRSPEYLLAKLAFNLLSGLFIGVAFLRSDNSLHGTQRKVFATFILTIICIPLASQLQVVFIDARRAYELRERHSRMYSWTAFVASHLVVELLWNVLSSIIFFSVWYWTTGFQTSGVVYSFLALGFIYPLYYTTQALALASASSSTWISSFLLCVSFSFTGVFDGVTHPSGYLRWQSWLYSTSPMSYLLEGFLGSALGRQQTECSVTEFLQLVPPSGQTCIEYLSSYIKDFGGYVNNPHGSVICEYCPARTTDEYLASRYNIFYAHRWRNAWIAIASCMFNIFLLFTLTYIFRIRRGRAFCFGRRKII